MNKKTYEEDLRRRQQEHLQNVGYGNENSWKPCLHDACSECIGTGVKKNGSICVHALSCNCPKCSVYC